MNEFRKAITAVAEHALALAEHDRTVFQLSGVDALDLLHRISTNDLLKDSVDRAITTVFCNEKGRVIEAAEVVIAGPDLFLICSTPGSQTLIEWIDKFTITEDIHLKDVSDDFSVDCIIGPQALRSISEVAPGDGRAWQGRFGSLPCIRILSAKGTRAEMVGRLHEKGMPVFESGRTYEFLRVLHSVPLFGHEIVNSYNPYEAGLMEAISFTKGCYIGQEVIARLDTYKKVQRQLRMLWSDSYDPPHPGTPVVVAGEQAGIVTSSTSGLGRTVTLAVLQKETARSHEVFRINDFPYVLNDTFPLPYSLIFRQDAS
jgi:tRNA-modifying protein YgfZ